MSSDGTERVPAAVQLKAKLRRHDAGWRMYVTEAQYHAQVHYACQLLEAVDEVAPAGTAALIVNAIYERLSRGDVSAAIEREWEARQQYERVLNEPWPPSAARCAELGIVP
jgi:hypothetical protein